MQMPTNGLALAIGSMFFMGVSTFLYKYSTDAIGPTNTTFFYYLFSIVIAAAVWIVFREKQDFARADLIWPLAIAICLFMSVWLFNLSLEALQISVASTIRGLFFVVTGALAFLVLKETPSPTVLYAMVFAVISVLLLGYDSLSK